MTFINQSLFVCYLFIYLFIYLLLLLFIYYIYLLSMWYLICLIIYKCRSKSVTHFKKSQCLLTAFAKVETRVVLD